MSSAIEKREILVASNLDERFRVAPFGPPLMTLRQRLVQPYRPLLQAAFRKLPYSFLDDEPPRHSSIEAA